MSPGKGSLTECTTRGGRVQAEMTSDAERMCPFILDFLRVGGCAEAAAAVSLDTSGVNDCEDTDLPERVGTNLVLLASRLVPASLSFDRDVDLTTPFSVLRMFSLSPSPALPSLLLRAPGLPGALAVCGAPTSTLLEWTRP